jgi:hypothetical protein
MVKDMLVALRGAIVLLMLAGSGFSAAQPIPVTNAGFETAPIADGAFAVLIPSGWTLYDPQGIVNQNANSVGIIRPNVQQTFFPTGAPEGAQAALVFLAGPINAPAGLQQTLAASLQTHSRYTLEVDIGNIASGTVPCRILRWGRSALQP